MCEKSKCFAEFQFAVSLQDVDFVAWSLDGISLEGYLIPNPWDQWARLALDYRKASDNALWWSNTIYFYCFLEITPDGALDIPLATVALVSVTPEQL